MKYDITLDINHSVMNTNDLPDDISEGHIFSFHYSDGFVLDTVCIVDDDPNPCPSCAYYHKYGNCPYDPDAGEYVCDVYKCAFKELDKILENL